MLHQKQTKFVKTFHMYKALCAQLFISTLFVFSLPVELFSNSPQRKQRRKTVPEYEGGLCRYPTHLPYKIENSGGESMRSTISRVKGGALNVYRAESRAPQRFAKIFREAEEETRNRRSAVSARAQLAGWSRIQYIPAFTLLIISVDRSCRCSVPGPRYKTTPREYTRVAGKANAREGKEGGQGDGL